MLARNLIPALLLLAPAAAADPAPPDPLELVKRPFIYGREYFVLRSGRAEMIVQADRVDDKIAAKMCRDIAKEIEAEMTYPGEVKVTLIRESRFVEVAH